MNLQVRHKKKYEHNQINRILIRGTNWIGDAVLTIPAIKSIRNGFPHSHISLLVNPWVRDIFIYNKDINEIITYAQTGGKITRIKNVISHLRAKEFDIAFLLQNAFEAALLTYLARIKYRVGYNTDCRSYLLTNIVYLKREILKVHQVKYYLSLAYSLGFPQVDESPLVYTSITEDSYIDKWLSANNYSPKELLVGINPGAYYGSAKRWSPERYAEVANILHKEYKANIVFLGGPQEIEMKEKIACHLRFNPLWATGNLSLIQTTALIKKCRLIITNDSGLMHLSAAVSTPVVAIFGSTDPHLTGPIGDKHIIIKKELNCQPCFKRQCPKKHLRCMELIKIEEILSAVERLL